jgi:hypothetical protein
MWYYCTVEKLKALGISGVSKLGNCPDTDEPSTSLPYIVYNAYTPGRNRDQRHQAEAFSISPHSVRSISLTLLPHFPRPGHMATVVPAVTVLYNPKAP